MAEDRVVRARDGVGLHVSVIGSGPAALIVPGTGNEADFEAHFANRRVAFFDIRNRGRSEGVLDSQAVGLPVEIDDIENVREAIDFERCSLFAWSYPALMAALYSARHPDRVDRLILACPPPASAADASELFTAGPRRQGSASTTSPVMTADAARTDRRASARLQMANPAGVDRLRSDPGAMANEWPDHVATALDRVWATFPNAFDFRADLRKITAPTLIIHGAEDRIPLESSKRLRELIPGARLVVIPGVGHFPHVEAPDEFSRSIDEFLSS